MNGAKYEQPRYSTMKIESESSFSKKSVSVKNSE